MFFISQLEIEVEVDATVKPLFFFQQWRKSTGVSRNKKTIDLVNPFFFLTQKSLASPLHLILLCDIEEERIYDT